MAKFIEQIKMKKLAKIIAGVTLGAVSLGTMSTTPVYAAEGMITGGTLNTDTKEYIGDAQKHAVVIDSSTGTALAKDMKIYGIKNTTGGTITGSVRADNFDSPSVTGLEIWGGWSNVAGVINGIDNKVRWDSSAKVGNITTITGFYANANEVSATDTIVTLNGANIDVGGKVYGANVNSGTGTATGTTLTLNNITTEGNNEIWGAKVESAKSATATGTTVNMTGGSVDGDFYGVAVGVNDKGVAEATDTTLTINGATLKYKSKGAYVKGQNSATAMAINTKVTMTGGELHNSFNAAEVQANEAGSIGQANNTTLIIDNTRLTISEDDGITGAHVTANAGGEILSATGTTVKLLNLTSTDNVGKELIGVQISGDTGFGEQLASATADTTEVEMNGGKVKDVVGAKFYHTKSAEAKVTTVTLNKVEADTVIGVNVTENKDDPTPIAENATANDTTVTVTGTKVKDAIIGVNVAAVTPGNSEAKKVTANNTKLTINGTPVEGDVTGVRAKATDTITATNTQVIFEGDASTVKGTVYGVNITQNEGSPTAIAETASATDTTVTLNGATVYDNGKVYGTHITATKEATATGTQVTLTNANIVFQGEVYGAKVKSTDDDATATGGGATATGTTLTLTNTTIGANSKIWGAHVEGKTRATATDTKVNMTGGSVGGEFYGVHVIGTDTNIGVAEATGTTLTINGATLEYKSRGAYVEGKKSGKANNTKVTMTGGGLGNSFNAAEVQANEAGSIGQANNTTLIIDNTRLTISDDDGIHGAHVTSNAGGEILSATGTTVKLLNLTAADTMGNLTGVQVSGDTGYEKQAKSTTADKTEVEMNGGKVKDVVGARFYHTELAEAKGTTVTLNELEADTVIGVNITKNEDHHSHIAENATANDTTVTVTGTTVTGAIRGVNVATVSSEFNEAKTVTADNTKLTINGTTVDDDVAGVSANATDSITAENTQVIFEGAASKVTGKVYGVWVKNMGTSTIENTNVDVTSSTIGATLYGVFQHNDESGSIAEKLVTNITTLSLNGATVDGDIHGVDSENIKEIEANGTKITLQGEPSSAKDVHGVLLKAKKQATADGTEVAITGGKIGSVTGTYIGVNGDDSGIGKAAGTKVTLNGVESDSVYGDSMSAKKQVTSDGAEVKVTGGKVRYSVRGAELTAISGADGEATAMKTTVTIKNTTETTREAVGAVVKANKKATADTTTVEVTGGTFETIVGGAQVIAQGEDGEAVAKNTKVTLTNVTAKGEMAGGLVISGEKSVDVNNTELNITGGTINAGIFAGVMVQGSSSKEMTVNDTKITLNGIESEKDFYGVASMSTKTSATPIKATNTEIIFEGDANEIKGTVWGTGQLNPLGANFDASNTSLTVKNSGNKVGNIANFHNLNFYIKEGITYGDTMVNITGSANTNIAGAKVGAIVEAKPKDNGDDKTINLLKNTGSGTITWTDTPKEGENYTIVVKDGAKLTLENTKNGVALSEDGTALVLTLGGIEESNDPEPGPKEIKPTSAATALFEDIVKNSDKMPESINKFWQSAVSSVASSSVENFQAAVSGAFQATEITGTTSTAVSVVNNVSNLTFSRMSLVDVGAGVSGGKGVGLMAPDSGAGVWARYVHGKDKADGMKMDGGSAEYSNSYNGVLVGADFKKVGKFQSGIFFSYVKGSGSNSFKDIMGATARYGHTDFHTYNFGYYGSVKNDDTNTMFDLSYGTTSSDSDTNGVGGAQSFSSKSKIFNAGVTAEKSFDISGMKLVPYTGLRYMHVDGGEYTDSLGINHKADKQNVFMLPVGFKLSKENKLSHDWTLTPKLDLSYTWNMGDTDSEMTVSVPGLTASNLSYRVMDKGSFMGVAGIEAQHKNCTYGVSYAYQKGSHQDSKKIIADIKWTF